MNAPYVCNRSRFATEEQAHAYRCDYFNRYGVLIAVEYRPQFPGWRNMSGVERRNARMHAMFDRARFLRKAETAR